MRARVHTGTHSILIQTLEAAIAPSQGSLSNHVTTWHWHYPGTDPFLHAVSVLLLPFAVLPYTPNSTVIYLPHGCLLVNGRSL